MPGGARETVVKQEMAGAGLQWYSVGERPTTAHALDEGAYHWMTQTPQVLCGRPADYEWGCPAIPPESAICGRCTQVWASRNAAARAETGTEVQG
jgi:hypothetical protein